MTSRRACLARRDSGRTITRAQLVAHGLLSRTATIAQIAGCGTLLKTRPFATLAVATIQTRRNMTAVCRTTSTMDFRVHTTTTQVVTGQGQGPALPGGARTRAASISTVEEA